MSGINTPPEPDAEIPDELAEQLGFENARRNWLKQATVTGELDTSGLIDELAADSEPEPDHGPDIEP